MRLTFLFLSVAPVHGFAPLGGSVFTSRSTRLYYEDDAPSDTGDDFIEAIPVLDLDPEAILLKKDIIDLADSTKRGFDASRNQRERAQQLVKELMQFNQIDEPASAYYVDAPAQGVSLTGKWTLVYTDAPDITTLDFGPLATAKLGRIGQECKPPFINNVIEWKRPDWATRLPLSGTDESRVLQKVCTEAVATPEAPTKVSLKLVGLDLLGMGGTTPSDEGVVDAIQKDGLPVGFLEKNPVEWRGPLSAPFGQFEVLYLDNDMRIIRTSQGFLAINVRQEEEWF